jgi:hypothetical protein
VDRAPDAFGLSGRSRIGLIDRRPSAAMAMAAAIAGPRLPARASFSFCHDECNVAGVCTVGSGSRAPNSDAAVLVQERCSISE